MAFELLRKYGEWHLKPTNAVGGFADQNMFSTSPELFFSHVAFLVVYTKIRPRGCASKNASFLRNHGNFAPSLHLASSSANFQSRKKAS